MDNSAVIAYNNGWRAVYRDDRKWYSNRTTGQDMPKIELSDFPWIRLRAYQDAERKKGVPIIMSDEKREFWYLRDYDFIHEDGTVEKYTFDSVEGQPVINVDWNFLLTGQFTNFRWRAGYPKGGQNAGV